MRRHQAGGEPFLVALLGGAVVMCSLAVSPVSLAATSSTIHSHICSADFDPPVITEPMSGYRSTLANVTVKGTGEPGMTVTVRVGGQPKAAATVAGDGSFATQVPLAVGNNTLAAREEDGCGNVKDSPDVMVERQQEPAPSPVPTPGGSSSPSQGGRAGRYGPSRFGSFPNVNGGSVGSNEKPSEESGGLEAPTITSLKEGQTVSSGHVWVAGTGQPGSVIIIYVNGKEVARVIVGEDGTYGVEVSLRPGENTIKAVEERDGKRIASRTWHVEYIQKAKGPQPMADVRWLLWTAVLAVMFLVLLAAGLGYRHYKNKREEAL